MERELLQVSLIVSSEIVSSELEFLLDPDPLEEFF